MTSDPAGGAPPAPPSPGPEPRRVAGGFTVREYEARVWDMAKHQLHPAGLYAVAAVAGLTRLLGHAALDVRGGAAVEVAFFACVFLGAWACFWSTLLRLAGLPSWTVTFLVPLTAAAAVVTWLALPPTGEMSAAAFWAAAASLTVPGPVAFAVTYRRWRIHRRAHLDLLPEADR